METNIDSKPHGGVSQVAAEKVGDSLGEIAERVVHAGQETAQRVIDRAKDMAARAGHTWNGRRAPHVSDLMSTSVRSCGPEDSLQRAAQIMWDNDCGVVPIVGDDGRLKGILTDRDICMAAYTQGRPLSQIHVSNVMAKEVHTVRANDPVHLAEELMRRVRVRRLPVLDEEGRLNGILSMSDLARYVHHYSFGRNVEELNGDGIAHTLGAICERHDETEFGAP